MKIIETKRSVELVNSQPVNTDNPSYLYELTSNGGLVQRHAMVLNTITSGLTKLGFDLSAAQQLDGLSFHNLGISVFGPYITNLNGEQVYTFRGDKTMVKLDKGMKHPEQDHHVKFPQTLYSCVSYENDGKAVKSIEYIAILKEGAIRFQYKYTPTNLRMTVLSNKELPDDVKNHLLNKVEQLDGNNSADVKTTNNPAIGFKLLLDLLNGDESNGTNHIG